MSDTDYDEFINLRAAIVRAVAITWNDKEFGKAFLKDPLGAMEKQFRYHCPFDLVVKAQSGRDASNPDHFDPLHTGGWVGVNNTLRFYLPPPPKDPKQRSEALAAFNQDHLLFLSRSSHVSED